MSSKQQSVFTTDGNHSLNHSLPAGELAVYCSGTFGGAAAFIAYGDDDNTMIPLTDGTLTAGNQYLVKCGAGMPIFAVISGATGITEISLKVKPLG